MSLTSTLIQPARLTDRSFRPGKRLLDTDGMHLNAHGAGMYYESGTYYLFGEHKVQGRAGNTAQVGVRVYSSPDLYTWKNEGVALEVVTTDDTHEIAKGCIIERPKVIRNPATGKYVMYFHLEFKGKGYATARCGVAVSDTVLGPYTFLASYQPHGKMARDMTLFVDEVNGAAGPAPPAYLFASSDENMTMRITRLSDDYLSPTGPQTAIFENQQWEAPTVVKHDGRYWFIGSGCTGWEPNPARSAVADSITGSWKSLGNPCLGAGKDRTFESQATYIQPIIGRPGCYLFMADRWRPRDPINGRYVWLPLIFVNGRPILHFFEEWDLSIFDWLAPHA